jgi:hypothetical protein
VFLFLGFVVFAAAQAALMHYCSLYWETPRPRAFLLGQFSVQT